MEPPAPEPRLGRVASGLLRTIALTTVSFVLLAACSAVGSRPRASAEAGPVGASSLGAPASVLPTGQGPSVAPTASVVPSGVVDTVEEALAAVVAEHPRFAGYAIRGAPAEGDESPGPIMGGGGGVIGARKWAIASMHESGIALTFMTGSGDCPAGCIHVRAETYLVTQDGSVTFLCAEDDPAAQRKGRAIVPAGPCASPQG